MYFSPNIFLGDQIKKNEMGRKCCMYERQERCMQGFFFLVGRPDGNRPLGRCRRRLENNIKMDLQDVGWGGMDSIALDEDGDRRRPLVSIKCRELRD